MEIRNWFYSIGILKSVKYSVPIISIGNITAGGTCKTPFTIYLAELLKNDYSKIAVVSRGYGRKGSGLQLVSDGKNILLDPYQSGDEPYLIASLLPGVLVAVSEKRSIAIDYIIENYQPDLIILDDAFQHRSVQRDVDIVLINSRETYQSKFILPTGNLREFRYNLKRADLIVLTNTPDDLSQNSLAKFTENIFRSRSVLSQLVDLNLDDVKTLDHLIGKSVFAFAGIAHPENFKEALSGAGISVNGFKEYRDHYNFGFKDFEEIINQCKKNDCQVLLCTEKDLVKIARLSDVENHLKNNSIQMYGVRLKLGIEEADLLVKNIHTILDNSM